jgi:hypothetical protein
VWWIETLDPRPWFEGRPTLTALVGIGAGIGLLVLGGWSLSRVWRGRLAPGATRAQKLLVVVVAMLIAAIGLVLLIAGGLLLTELWTTA